MLIILIALLAAMAVGAIVARRMDPHPWRPGVDRPDHLRTTADFPDKLVHLVFSFALASALLLVRVPWWLALPIALGVGVGWELGQARGVRLLAVKGNPYILDIAADALGVLGAALAFIVGRLVG